MKELNQLRLKASFIPVKKRRIQLLLASGSGYTEELRRNAEDGILGEKDDVL